MNRIVLTLLALAVTGCQVFTDLDGYSWYSDTDSDTNSTPEYGTGSSDITVVDSNADTGSDSSTYQGPPGTDTDSGTYFYTDSASGDSDTDWDSVSDSSTESIETDSDSVASTDSETSVVDSASDSLGDSGTDTFVDTIDDTDADNDSGTDTFMDTVGGTNADSDSVSDTESDTGGDTDVATDEMPCVTGTGIRENDTLNICIGGEWTTTECIGITPYCYGDSCVQCLPGNSECSGYDQRICNSDGSWEFRTCDHGCIDGRCLQQSAYETPGVVQCDLNVVCPSEKVCCFDIENRHGTCEDECEHIDGVQGSINCDGKSDCESGLNCCVTQYSGEWVFATCGVCKAPVPELRVRATCLSEDDCSSDSASCEILYPTTTLSVCQ